MGIRIDRRLAVIGVILAVSVLLMSYFYDNGRTSSDSVNYLRLARSLVDGRGFYLSDIYRREEGTRFFAQWPVGYPLFIALAAKILGLSVFWASKWLNLLFLSITLLLLSWVFKSRAYVFGLVLFTASPLNVLSMTWSENGMILGLLAMSVFLYKYYKSGKWFWLVALQLSYWWIFLMRYAGVFVIPVLLVIALALFYKKKIARGLMLLVVSTVSVLSSLLYLWHNVITSGYVLGRAPTVNSLVWGQRTKVFLKAIIGELNMFFDMEVSVIWLLLSIAVVTLIVGIFFIPTLSEFKELKKNNKRWLFFVLIGASQLLAMIYLFIFPGTLDNRYLLPTSFLLLIALVDYWSVRPMTLLGLKRTLLVVAVISWTINVPGKLFYQVRIKDSLTYSESAERVLAKYSSIPTGSVVAFADKKIMYLRPDINVAYLSPETFQITDKEFGSIERKLDYLMERTCRVEPDNFYIHVNMQERSLNYWMDRDSSVAEFVKGHHPDEMVKIDNCRSFLVRAEL